MTITMRGVALIAIATVLACGSGGSDEPGASSSSGSTSGGPSTSSSSGGSSSGAAGGSSGTSSCEAICTSSAIFVFEESNAGDRLEGAVVEACFRDECATGTIVKNDGGTGWGLTLALVGGATAPPNVEGTVGPVSNGNLRFRIQFFFGEGTGSGDGLTDGDSYTVKAAKAGEPALFEKSFTATYREANTCNTRCKVFDPAP